MPPHSKESGLHANTQVPKFVGAARQYELTGDPKLQTAAKFFWDTVVNERSYVIGGHSDGEHFSPKERLSQALGPATTETCNTYNMLKLTRHLFCGDARAQYADYYERALYNHILASQHPETGMMCYYVPLRSGSAKGGRGYGYNSPLDSFWCCTGNGRKWRHAVEGWFSYELKVLPDQPQQLWVTYWGSDGGARTFDVLVDGERLVTQRLDRNRPDTFFEEITPLPEAMTRGKQSVTIRFEAHPGNWAGGVFGLRIMRQPSEASQP